MNRSSSETNLPWEKTLVQLVPIGWVRSKYSRSNPAPNQGFLGASAAQLTFDESLRDGFANVRVGDELILLTWLHQSRRDTLMTRPQNNPALPLTGVFSTRSPDRPNPIGLHRVTVTAMTSPIQFEVAPLEVFDETPILDVKPVLRQINDDE